MAQHSKAEQAAINKALAKKQREATKAAQAEAAKAKQEAAKAAQAGPTKEEREAAKAAADAAKAKDIAQTEKTLAPIAKEVNVRIEKAAKLDGDADDHRLAAALQLAKAKALCEEHKISFKEWAEKNVTTQAYETIRKLAAVGASDDPKLALADLRSRTKTAQKTHRDKKKAGSRNTEASASGPKQTPFNVADAAFKQLDEKTQLSLIESKAGKLGMRVISAEEAKAAKSAIERQEKVATHGIDALKASFNALKAGDKLAFIRWAAEQIGATVSTGFEADSAKAPDPGEIPTNLRRAPSRRRPEAAETAAA